MQRDRHPNLPLILWPTLLMLLLLFFHESIDLRVSEFFYEKYPRFQAGSLWSYVYHYGVIPALLVGIISVGFLIMQISPKWQKYRTAALMAFLSLAIGPGLLINTGLKGYLQRPRPIQLEKFGGKYQYIPMQKIEVKTSGNNQKSFPCGHVSMGFYFLCLWRIAEREGKKAWARRSLLIAIILSGLLGWARMAQGGHFISDVLLSGYLVWLVTMILERWCYGKRERSKIS